MENDRCQICGLEKELFMLKKCPMCHKYFCDACEYKHGGHPFCSRGCAYLFYFPDEDDESEDL